jgi:hypothetical protein
MHSMFQRIACCCLLALGIIAVSSAPASAGLDPYAVPALSCESSTLASITLHVCGGTTGAPAGVTIQWKSAADFALNGWGDGTDLCALSLSGQPSLQHPGASRWDLGAGECEDITIGDINFDETGVSGTGCGLDPLQCGTDYVFRIFAHAGRGFGRSDFSGNITCSTAPCPTSRCTYTQGYWKNHGGPAGCNQAPVNAPDPVWPASVISGGMTLGSVHYSAADLCLILNTPGAGKGLVTLAHQLIAANLNLANQATGCASLTQAINDANAAIGNVNLVTLAGADCTGPPSGRPAGCGTAVPDANTDLTNFNEGVLGGLCGPHCSVGPALKSGATPTAPSATQHSSWGKVKSIYR